MPENDRSLEALILITNHKPKLNIRQKDTNFLIKGLTFQPFTNKIRYQ